MALDAGVMESIANSNVMYMSEAATLEAQRTTAAKNQEAERSSKTLNIISETALGNTVSSMQQLGIGEATAISTVMRNDVAPLMAGLSASLAGVRAFLAGTAASTGT